MKGWETEGQTGKGHPSFALLQNNSYFEMWDPFDKKLCQITALCHPQSPLGADQKKSSFLRAFQFLVFESVLSARTLGRELKIENHEVPFSNLSSVGKTIKRRVNDQQQNF